VTVVVGGQFGSEGKGKVTQFLARHGGATMAIRVGGPNSGHTGTDDRDAPVILRQLPTPALVPGVRCVVAAGSVIDPPLLLEEVARTGLDRHRLYIDENATVLLDCDRSSEQERGLRAAIGSTLSGTGAALVRRIAREPGVRRAGEDTRLRAFVHTGDKIRSLLRECLDAGERIVIEGTQGFGLSVLHSPYYPFATSRDTTAGTFVAEAGLSPLDVDEIYLVLRAFPIRVGGNSGPLPKEIDWNTISTERGAGPIIEYTSVTRSVRRVARFDSLIVRQAIAVNRPSHIVLNHLDYVDVEAWRKRELTATVTDFVRKVELLIERRVDLCGLGPSLLVDNHRTHGVDSSPTAAFHDSIV